MTAKQSFIIQRDGITYCRVLTPGPWNITGVNQGTKTFSVAESVAPIFTDGTSFTVSGSTGNDGIYTVNGDATGTTDIIVDQAIPDATVDGAISAAFTDRDLEALDYDAETTGGVQFPLWTDETDIVHVGHSATFAWAGFRMHTAGDYGTFTFEYWDGFAWSALTPLVNSTLGFERSGYIAWSIPGDWALTTIGGKVPSAFWVRASQDNATPGTIAQAYNLLRNATFDKPIVMQPMHEKKTTVRDVNSVLRLKDIPTKTPDRLIIDATHLALTMPELNLLWDMKEQVRPVFIWDGTFTAANPSFTDDAYYESYEGYIDVMPPRAMSPSKMEPFEYTIEVVVDTVKTLADRLGANA